MAESRRPLPGPPGYPLVGNLFDIDLDNFHQLLTSWGQVHGPIYQFSILGKKAVVLSSVALMEEAFERNAAATSGRPATAMGSLVLADGDIVLCPDHTAASRLKRTLEHGLYSHPAVPTYLQAGLREAMSGLRQKLRDLNGADVDLREATERLHIDFTTHLLVGETVPEGSPDYCTIVAYIDGIDQILLARTNRTLLTFPFLKCIGFSSTGQVLRDVEAAHAKIGKKFYTEQKASWKKDVTRGIIDVAIAKQHGEGETTGWPSDGNVRGLLADTFFTVGGQHMKSCLVVTKLLCGFPEVQFRIQREIDAVIGSEEFPTPDMRSRMPFTQAAILESLRYCNFVPLTVPHECTDDVTVAGYHIQKGTTIVGNLYAILHNDEIWGDPLEFRPDRFLDNDGKLLPSNSEVMKSWTVFSVGSRRCPGSDLLLTFLFHYTTSVLHKFTICPAEGAGLPKPETILSRHLKPVFPCRFVPRE